MSKDDLNVADREKVKFFEPAPGDREVESVSRSGSRFKRDFRSNVAEVVGRQRLLDEFFNNRHEVGKRADLRKWRFGWIPANAASGRQEQSGFDGLKRYCAGMPLLNKMAIEQTSFGGSIG
jgi:hypothetical protein